MVADVDGGVEEAEIGTFGALRAVGAKWLDRSERRLGSTASALWLRRHPPYGSVSASDVSGPGALAGWKTCWALPW